MALAAHQQQSDGTGPGGDLRERIAVLESQMEELVGNGQPGRIAGLEKAIVGLSRFQWIAIGMVMLMQFLSSSGVVSLRSVLPASSAGGGLPAPAAVGLAK